MKKILAIIILLGLAGGVGFYFGMRDRSVKVVVHETAASEQVGTSTMAVTGTTDLVIPGDRIAGNLVSDFFGESFQDELPKLPWLISRSSGIAAYLLMFLVVVWGMGMSIGFIYVFMEPITAWSVHKYLSIALGLTLFTHIFSLPFDHFINFSLGDILIPFHSDFKSAYLALGIIGFYLLLLVVLSSLFLRLRSPKIWRTIHYAVYPLFILSFSHGIFMGTDTATPAMRLVYLSTSAIFMILVFYRLIASHFLSRGLDRPGNDFIQLPVDATAVRLPRKSRKATNRVDGIRPLED